MDAGIRQTKKETLTIASGAAVSGSFEAAGFLTGAVYVPVAWTAADIAFESSLDGGTTWFKVYSSATARLKITSVPTGAVACCAIPAGVLDGARLLRLASINTASGANETQGGDRTLYVVLKS